MNILQSILSEKREEVERRKASVPPSALFRSRWYNRSTLSLLASLREQKFGIIAEIKKASPSKGILRNNFDPAAIAVQYVQGGAAAISVLTDEKFFQGSLDYLSAARELTSLPLLRKDFVIDRYQLVEARAAGADAILLIAAALEPAKLRNLYGDAVDLGLEVLVEVHDDRELENALNAGARLIGINNRNLQTFNVDLRVTERLMTMVPREVSCVSESGIMTGKDLLSVRDAGCVGALIGESFMRKPDPGQALREMISSMEEGRS